MAHAGYVGFWVQCWRGHGVGGWLLRGAGGCLVSLCLCAATSGDAAAAERRIDSILASVNGEPISLLDVLLDTSWEERRLSNYFRGDELSKQIENLRRIVVDEMIERKLIFAEFQKRQFEIPAQMVEDNLSNMALAMGDADRVAMFKRAATLGISADDLRRRAFERVAVEAMISEFCFRPAQPTPKQVYELYQELTRSQILPASVQLDFLRIARDGRFAERLPETLEEVGAAVKSGRSNFAALRQFYCESEAASGDEWIEEDKLRPEFYRALLGVDPDGVAGPVELADGFYFLHLRGWRPAAHAEFAEVRERLRRELESEMRVRRYQEYVDRLRAKAVIRVFF